MDKYTYYLQRIPSFFFCPFNQDIVPPLFGRDDAALYVEEGDTQFLLLDFQAGSTMPIVPEEILGLTYT